MTEIQDKSTEPEQGTDSGGAIEVGRRLKEAREKAGTDINELAVRLRLTSSQLAAIERGDLGQFGAPIYVRGYVANYARLVGLKPKPLLERLSLEEEEPPLTAATGSPPGQRLAENLARVATYAVGTVVLALPLVWWASEGSLDALFGGPKAPESESVAAADPDVGGETGVAGGAAQDRAPPGNDRQADDQPLMASMALPRGSRQSGSAGETAGDTETEAASEGKAQATGAEAEPVVEMPPELVLEVSEDSWVEIRDDAGERLEYDLLRAGTTHRYQGTAPYRVLVGNAGAVTVRYNDAPFDMAPFIQGNLARFEVGAGPDEG